MLLNCGVGEDSWESLGLHGDPTSPFWRGSAMGFLWKEWCKSWNSSTLATSCEELTHWKRLWCLEGLGAGGEGDDRGWDGWMASPTGWLWVWVNLGSWWWTGRRSAIHGVAKSRIRLSDWAELSLFNLHTNDYSKYEKNETRKIFGEGNGNPLHCSCLENPRDGGAWWVLSMGSHRVGHDWSDLAVALYSSYANSH